MRGRVHLPPSTVKLGTQFKEGGGVGGDGARSTRFFPFSPLSVLFAGIAQTVLNISPAVVHTIRDMFRAGTKVDQYGVNKE